MHIRFFRFLVILVLLCCTNGLQAQNDPIKTYNRIGWFNYFGTFSAGKKLSIHTEYQWRRNDFMTTWQQSLLRVGLNYQPKPNVLFRAGYGWIETWPYGDLAINTQGLKFTEHRIYEMVQFQHKEGKFFFSHRLMPEQRFVERYKVVDGIYESSYAYMNRMRYMFRVNLPLKGKEIADGTPYIAVYDEIFIGFGKNVTVNVFDQNRFGAMLGFRFNPMFRLEAGYLNQIVQFGRQIEGQNVFQYNNGIIMNAIFDFRAAKQ